jgi:hypothetical protein
MNDFRADRVGTALALGAQHDDLRAELVAALDALLAGDSPPHP